MRNKFDSAYFLALSQHAGVEERSPEVFVTLKFRTCPYSLPCRPYVLHFVESDPTYCRELSSVMALNNFSYSLDCAKASHEGLAKWILSQDLSALF